MICALALILLLDGSGSIRAPDWEAQVEGHAAAFEDPAIQRAIALGGPVAVAARVFDDATRPLTAWHLVATPAEARAFAASLRAAPRGGQGGTDIGRALTEAVASLPTAPCTPDDQVIDLVTDGEADARSTAAARDAAIAAGVRINALGVGSATAADWLREHVVTPNGFVMAAEGWAEFATAIRRKVSLEIAAR